MSMTTIFVLFEKGEALQVAPSTSADEALRFFQGVTIHVFGDPAPKPRGELYAARMSEEAADAVRALLEKDCGKQARLSATKSLKSFAHSLTKCADVT
jgi:hypothetical protein